MKKKHLLLTLLLPSLFLSGCGTNMQTGALFGGGSGAIIGGLAGGWPWAFGGAAIGVLTGGTIGAFLDQNEVKAIKDSAPDTYAKIKTNEERRRAQKTLRAEDYLNKQDIINLKGAGYSDRRVQDVVNVTGSRFAKSDLDELKNNGKTSRGLYKWLSQNATSA